MHQDRKCLDPSSAHCLDQANCFSYTILAFSAPPKQVAAYTGILGAVYAIASVIGM